jgi:hypothetical protein
MHIPRFGHSSSNFDCIVLSLSSDTHHYHYNHPATIIIV